MRWSPGGRRHPLASCCQIATSSNLPGFGHSQSSGERGQLLCQLCADSVGEAVGVVKHHAPALQQIDMPWVASHPRVCPAADWPPSSQAMTPRSARRYRAAREAGPESATSTHQEPLMIHCRACSVCPAGKCLISAETKCDVKCSATSPMWESVTTPILFMRL